MAGKTTFGLEIFFLKFFFLENQRNPSSRVQLPKNLDSDLCSRVQGFSKPKGFKLILTGMVIMMIPWRNHNHSCKIICVGVFTDTGNDVSRRIYVPFVSKSFVFCSDLNKDRIYQVSEHHHFALAPVSIASSVCAILRAQLCVAYLSGLCLDRCLFPREFCTLPSC